MTPIGNWLSSLEQQASEAPLPLKAHLSQNQQVIQTQLVNSLLGKIPAQASITCLDPKFDLLMRSFQVYKIAHEEKAFFDVVSSIKKTAALPLSVSTDALGATPEERFEKLLPIYSFLKAQIEPCLAEFQAIITSQQDNALILSKRVTKLGCTIVFQEIAKKVECGIIGRRIAVGTIKIVKFFVPLSIATEVFTIASLNKQYRKDPEHRFMFLFKHEEIHSVNLKVKGIKGTLLCKALQQANRIKLFMNFCNEGTLHSYLSVRRPLFDRLRLGGEISGILKEFHKHGLCHLDMKYTNILIATINGIAHAFFIDYLTVRARVNPDKSANTIDMCSSQPAPEMCLNAKNGLKTPVSPALDLWSIGPTLFALLFPKETALQQKINQLTPQTQDIDTCVQEINEIVALPIGTTTNKLLQAIAMLFSRDPEKRTPAAQLEQLFDQQLKDYQDCPEAFPELVG